MWKMRAHVKYSYEAIKKKRRRKKKRRETALCKGDFGEYSIAGALAGAEYGKYAHTGDYRNINNWQWLRERFEKETH